MPAHVLWCLGRLGARVPLYGPANTVVPQGDRRALDQVASGTLVCPRPRDRRRDLRPGATRAGRQRPGARPRRSASERGHRPAHRPGRRRTRVCGRSASITSSKSAQQAQALGDSLPIGLRLLERRRRDRLDRSELSGHSSPRVSSAISLRVHPVREGNRHVPDVALESGRGSTLRCRRTSGARAAARAFRRGGGLGQRNADRELRRLRLDFLSLRRGPRAQEPLVPGVSTR